MIILENIEKSFDYPVLHKINYTFQKGKIYIIKGVSGCGKSTLLNIIGGLDSDYVGEVKVDGKTLITFNKKELEQYRDKVSYIFQNSLLISKLSIKENLLFLRDDLEKIIYYSEKVGCVDLLDKYPEQLSGGERQRVALIRAMLNEPEIMIADEPTASLDTKNSVKIATLLRELTNDNCVTIIATHENCFDEIADEIIELNYGKIDTVIKNTDENHPLIQHKVQDKKFKQTSSKKFWLYVYKRNREKISFGKLLPSTIIFLTVIFGLALQSNIQKWYINTVLQNYPYTMLSVSNDQYNELNNMYEFEVYDNYTYLQEGISVYPLFEERDSGISYSNIVEFGRFPENDHEIIVTKDYVKQRVQVDKAEDALSKTVLLGKEEFEIVGILSDLNEGEQSLLFYSNAYYQNYNPVSLFIPYNRLKQIGTPVETSFKMIKMEGLYDSEANYKWLRSYLGGPITEWDNKLVDVQYLIDSIVGVFLCGILILSVISIIFIKNEVQLELYYRRKEIGFLQIFSLSKNKIQGMILFERSARSCVSLFLAEAIYICIALGMQIFTNYSIIIKPSDFFLFTMVVVGYVILVTWIPCKKYLKKDIIELII